MAEVCGGVKFGYGGRLTKKSTWYNIGYSEHYKERGDLMITIDLNTLDKRQELSGDVLLGMNYLDGDNDLMTVFYRKHGPAQALFYYDNYERPERFELGYCADQLIEEAGFSEAVKLQLSRVPEIIEKIVLIRVSVSLRRSDPPQKIRVFAVLTRSGSGWMMRPIHTNLREGTTVESFVNSDCVY